MRHLKSGKKLGRTPSHRKALFRNMVTSLLQHERIVTTEVKAKEVGRLAEKMITLGKRGDLHARRQAIAFVRSNEVVKRVFTEYAERYRNREGGYTRVLKLEPRSGDNAPMALVELVDRPVREPAKEKKPAKEAAKKAKAPEKKEKAAKPKKAPAKKAGKEEEKPAAKKTTKKAAAEKKAPPSAAKKKTAEKGTE
ncbi:MAG: 50S ribosomal protein L17 [bacterium]|nr:MAG: 50S ribosomal protein L17 [bacterium]